MREVEHLSRLYIAHQFVMAEVKWTGIVVSPLYSPPPLPCPPFEGNVRPVG